MVQFQDPECSEVTAFTVTSLFWAYSRDFGDIHLNVPLKSPVISQLSFVSLECSSTEGFALAEGAGEKTGKNHEIGSTNCHT